MSRECRKCGEKIPYQITINGRKHNLQTRKFCLSCSPFKKHNTSPNDPILRKGRTWKDFSEDRKTKSKLSNYFRALKTRRELYQSHGGKCVICGYCECERALTFHHRNPQEKCFGLSLDMMWCKSKDSLEAESKKCDLLCMNCHAEVEDKIAKKNNGIVAAVNAKYGTNF